MDIDRILVAPLAGETYALYGESGARLRLGGGRVS
jgi:hypothetical protein